MKAQQLSLLERVLWHEAEATLRVYPDAPGARDVDTSRAAAADMQPRSATLRDAVMILLEERDRTADECAAELRETVLAIRPRLSELRAKGRIEDSGQRRRNDSGKMAVVWRRK